jgi:hypothetical protein
MAKKSSKTNGATLADHSEFPAKMVSSPGKHASMVDSRDVMGLSEAAHAAKDLQGGGPMISKFGGDQCFGGKGCS